jgi:poly(hydroxyalkanoate) granule-associated protein
MFANSWIFASAGTPGGYDLSQIFSTGPASIIVAMGVSSAGMGKCNLRAAANKRRADGSNPAKTNNLEMIMATRKKGSHSSYSNTANDAGKAVSDSAQKIWQAGLGAFERAKTEGPKMFDTLVEQGKTLGGKARDAADQAMKSVREGGTGAAGRFDKLEQVFEDRVSKSLNRLGVLTRGELADLSKQVRDLTDDVRKLSAKSGRNAGAAKRKVKRAASTAKRKAKKR